MISKQRYFLQLSFNGKNYHGWQVQKNAHSVQQELNNALQTLLKKEIATIGCGRTDTGVHAKIFFSHFDFEKKVEDHEQFLHQLNCILPRDIAVQRIIPVKHDAHARFDATSRTYEYFLYRVKNPFEDGAAYFYPYDLDLKKMNHAAKILFEYEDFSCFSKNRTQVKTNLCTITEAKWFEQDGKIVFRISANRFLRNMVRAIVGTLLKIGREQWSEDDLRKIIEGKKRSDAGASVDACGLYLTDVKYPFLKNEK